MPTQNRKDRALNSELYLGHERFLELNGALQETYERLDGTLAGASRPMSSRASTSAGRTCGKARV